MNMFINSNGLITVAFLNYGAMLLSFKAPDRNGVIEVTTVVICGYF